MKNKINLILLTLFFTVGLSAQNLSEVNHVYKGTIGKSGFTMSMYVDEHSHISGIYYYDKIKKNIYLEGFFSKDKNFEIREFVFKNDKKLYTGIFVGKVNKDNSIGGDWLKNKEASKKISFNATEVDCLNKAYLETFAYENTTYLDNANEEVYCTVEYEYTFPVNAKSFEAYKIMMSRYFEKNFSNDCDNIPTCVRRAVKNFEAEFNSQEYLPGADNFMYCRSISETSNINYNYNNFLSMTFYYSVYLGGAHPEFGQAGFVFDLITGKEITLDDVFKNSESDKLLALIKNKIIEMEVDVWMGNVCVTDNFTFDDEGVSFYYNPYEIGPYSTGTVIVDFKYSELKKLLTPDFRIRMRI